MLEFDYRTASRAEILERAQALVGMKLGEVATRPANRIHSTAETKGSVGAIYERFFGIPSNNLREPDFLGARIELKSVPLEVRRKGWVVKERTVVTMIDYMRLAAETWASATVRKKVGEVLLVFYEWKGESDIYDFPTRNVHMWRPTVTDDLQFRQDWSAVVAKVAAGKAHLISERDGLLLGAATKGENSLRRVRQPFSSELAKPRAWALKAAFMNSILLDLTSNVPVESVVEVDRPSKAPASARRSPAAIQPSPPPTGGEHEVEDIVGRRLQPFVGLHLSAVMKRLGIRDVSGKAKGALIVRRALGLSDRSRVREFERVGLQVKTVRLSLLGRPYEAMSFPAFRYRELITEEWSDSDLLRLLNRLLVVPLIGATRETPFEDCVLGPPFFWTPSAAELDGIEVEWTLFRNEIAAGKAEDLTPASQTKFIHVRPKGRNRQDTDDAPIVGPAVKKCFWLNQSFVEQIIREHGGRTP